MSAGRYPVPLSTDEKLDPDDPASWMIVAAFLERIQDPDIDWCYTDASWRWMPKRLRSEAAEIVRHEAEKHQESALVEDLAKLAAEAVDETWADLSDARRQSAREVARAVVARLRELGELR
ncbi:hypothetical protein [Gordonia iterans]